MNYDPNYFKDATHTIRLTLASWEYRGTFETTVGGNCKGADILEAAINNFVDHVHAAIDGPDGQWEYVLVDPNGDTLSGEIYAEDEHGFQIERECRQLVIGAEIIAFGGPEVDARRARTEALRAEVSEEK